MNEKAFVTWALIILLSGGSAVAQPAPANTPAHSHNHPTNEPDLAKQLEQLKAQLATLQAGLAHQHPSSPPSMPPSMGRTGAMGAGSGMGMPMGAGGAVPMASNAAPAGMAGGGMGMGMMGQSGMGCCSMMGQMSPAGGMAMSVLPGFPGASHIYHIGETGFFLDHPEHITLTPEQASNIAKIRDGAVQSQGEFQRKLSAAEEQLWQLTASDQPTFSTIEAKAREIEKLRSDQRLAFIRAVGEAAKLLTDDQRKTLLGQLPPVPNPSTGMAQPMQPGAPMGGAPMMDDSMAMPPSGAGAAPMGGSSAPPMSDM